MSAEDDAFEAARRLIAEAGRNADDLDLDREETRALTRLPPEIGELHALRSLYMRKTRITDIDPLAGLTGLTMLWLNNTQVARLDPLAGLTGLTMLWLNNTQVARLDPLAGLTGLTTLWLDNTKRLADLRPVAGLVGLVEAAKESPGGLHFSGSRVCDLDPDGLGQLAGIKDNVERTEKTLAYLRGLTVWPPTPPVPPEGRPGAPRFAGGEDGPVAAWAN